MRVAPPVVLSPEERSRLRRWSGSRTDPQRAARARLVLRAAEGAQDLEIARELGWNRLTVARWRERFRRSRLGGLEPLPRVVREGRVPVDRVRAIVRATLAYAATGRPPSTRSLGRSLGVSHMTVRRVWAAYGLRPARWVPLPARADPLPAERPWDVAGLLLDPPRAAIAFTVHPGAPASPSATGDTPAALPGGLAPILAEGGRLGSAEARPGRADTGQLIRFLGRVDARLGGELRASCLLTGVSAAEGELVERWRIRHPRIRVDRVPDLEGWRRRVEAILATAGRSPGPEREFRGRAEVLRSLRRSVLAFQPGTGSFEWVAAPRDLAEGEAAYRLRYDLAVTGSPSFMSPVPLGASMKVPATPDEQRRAMARTVLRKNLRVARGERVTIETWTSTLAEANALVLEALRAHARPLVLYQDEPTYWAAASEVAPRQLAALGEHRKAALGRTDAFVSFYGPSDRERFHALPPATMFQLGSYQDALYEAAEKAGARAVQMALGRVSPASARMYGVEEAVWRTELVQGCLVDPAALHRSAGLVADRLERGRELEIRHSNGTHLTLALRGRTPTISDGIVPRPKRGITNSLTTLPAGVVSVAVDERTAEGLFRSNVTSSIGLSDTVGELVGGRWTFREGRLANYRYEGGEEFFQQSYSRAREGRDRPASISIGLNPALERAPLLEDQGLGTVTMHIGRNDYLGGRTTSPWWAWLFLRGADVLVDGKPIVDGGRLGAGRAAPELARSSHRSTSRAGGSRGSGRSAAGSRSWPEAPAARDARSASASAPPAPA